MHMVGCNYQCITVNKNMLRLVAVLYSVALKAAKRDLLSELRFDIMYFSIKVFFRISKQSAFAIIINDFS